MVPRLPDLNVWFALVHQDARRKYANCKKQVKLQAFRDAIATEDAPSVVDTMDVDSMGASAPDPVLVARTALG